MMHRRTSLSLATVLLAAAVLVGCTPTPEPTPTPTALFASEDEAYAAAEATYREYLDADNLRRAGDPSAKPDELLTGAAYETYIDSLAPNPDSNAKLTGDFVIASFVGTTASLTDSSVEIEADICIDASGTHLIDEDGSDVTPPDAPEFFTQHVTFIQVANALLISSEIPGDAPCE